MRKFFELVLIQSDRSDVDVGRYLHALAFLVLLGATLIIRPNSGYSEEGSRESFFDLIDPNPNQFEVVYRHEGQSGFRGSPSKIRLERILTSADLPIDLSKELSIDIGIEYSSLSTFTKGDSPISRNMFTSVVPSLGAEYLLSSDLLITGNISLENASNSFSQFNTGSVDIGGVGIAFYRIENDMAVGAGILRVNNLLNGGIYPVLAFDWRDSTKSTRINIQLPDSAEISRKLTQNEEIYFGAWSDLNDYDVGLVGANRGVLHTEEDRIGVGLREKLFGPLSCYVEVGRVMNRRFELKDTEIYGRKKIQSTDYIEFAVSAAF